MSDLVGRHMDRRRFLGLGAMGAAGFALGTSILAGRQAAAAISGYPFKLGVASGDPLPDGVVLWTRLAPNPLNGGGMPRRDVAVRWEVSADDDFTRIVRRGTATATPERAHSVHVEVSGLQPGRYYWYRFEAGGSVSRVGRTKTAPEGAVGAMSFAFVSCQNFESGFYHVYRAIARDELDLVVHLGDYIYEMAAVSWGVRSHRTGEAKSLDDYRNRHALYKSDRDLRDAHAAHPFFVTWDDHEVDNNYAGLVANDGLSRERFATRRRAAYRAYYEHMPLRRLSIPTDAGMRIYRRLNYGRLARISALDTRQYRTDQPCGDGLKERCAESLSQRATMTGPAQERWLLDGLGDSPSQWNVIGNQTIMSRYDHDPGEGGLFNMDAWDGYVAARNRILGYLNNRRPSNPVVICGDVHSSWVNDLKSDFKEPRSRTVGTEFIGPPVSSRLSSEAINRIRAARSENPHVKYFSERPGGYVRCSLNSARWKSDYRIADSVRDRGSNAVRTVASFVVEDGRPGAVRA